jgi:hypothetical protein
MHNQMEKVDVHFRFPKEYDADRHGLIEQSVQLLAKCASCHELCESERAAVRLITRILWTKETRTVDVVSDDEYIVIDFSVPVLASGDLQKCLIDVLRCLQRMGYARYSVSKFGSQAYKGLVSTLVGAEYG